MIHKTDEDLGKLLHSMVSVHVIIPAKSLAMSRALEAVERIDNTDTCFLCLVLEYIVV